MLLTDEGYVPLVAPNGAVAVDLVRRTPPRLISLDLMMPVMDRRASLRACRAEALCRDVPVVVMSAAKNAPAVEELRAEWFLANPFDVEVLLSVVEQCA